MNLHSILTDHELLRWHEDLPAYDHGPLAGV